MTIPVATLQSEYTNALQDKAKLVEDINAPGIAAQATLTLTANAAATETVTIDGKVYTFQTVLTDVDGHVLRGATASGSIDNLIAAIMLGSGAGVKYAASTTLHLTVEAEVGPGDTMTAIAKDEGPDGNSIAISDTLGFGSWNTATLTGGTVDLESVRDKSIEEAIRWYETRIPQVKTILVAASSTPFYAVPSDWQTFSRVVSVEWPLDSTPPTYLTAHRGIKIQRRETGLYHFLTPNPGGSFRFTYTTKHDDASGGSYPSLETRHAGALGKMAASIALIAMASFFAKTANSQSDAVNYRTKEQEARSVAKEFRDQVEREISLYELRQVAETDIEAIDTGWRI